MGIYDKPGLGTGAGMPRISAKYALFAILVVAIILLVMLVAPLFQSKPTMLWLDKSQIKADETTFLNVQLTNYTQDDLRLIDVHATAHDPSAISLSATTPTTLEIIGPGETRTITFLVNPVASCEGCYVLPGNYLIDVTIYVAGREYFTDQLTIKIIE